MSKLIECPHCKLPIPAFVDRTAGASKLAAYPNDFLWETLRGVLLRVRVTFTRLDQERGLYHYKAQIAPAADLSGDVLKDAGGANVFFPAGGAVLKQDCVRDGRIVMTDELAQALAQEIAAAEARVFATRELAGLVGRVSGEPQ